MGSSGSVADVLQTLRANTQDDHQRLEGCAVFSCLMSESVSVDQYIQALRVLLRSYQEIEPRLLQGLANHFPTYRYTPRIPLLRNDLRYLSEPVDTGGMIHASKPFDLAETLGALYVVEGSTLGGRMLSKHLYERIGAPLTGALSIYDLGGELKHDHWGQVQSILREQVEQGVEVASIVNAAKECFASFIFHGKNSR